MRIISAAELLQLCTPGERAGVWFVEWNGQLYSMVQNGAQPVAVDSVHTALKNLDAKFPYIDVAWTDNVDILCLPYVQWFLASDGSPGVGGAVRGEHREGIVTISAGEDHADLLDLLAHELRHLWAYWIGARTTPEMPIRWAEFFAITGLNPDEQPIKNVPWDERRQELLAELVGTATEGLRLDPDMEDDLPAQYRMVALAEWARKLTPRRKRVELRIGSNLAYINGVGVELDQPPQIMSETNRTLVPLRFVAEALDANVIWDATTQLITITKD